MSYALEFSESALQGLRALEPRSNRSVTLMLVLEIYNQIVKPLPLADRLRLAALVLNAMVCPPGQDVSGKWSDEDLRDFANSTWDSGLAGD